MSTTRNTTTRYTDQELKDLLIWLTINKIGMVNNRDIGKSQFMPTHHTYINRFGSVMNARQEAGVEDVYDDHTIVILDFLLDMLTEVGMHAKRVDLEIEGKILSIVEISADLPNSEKVSIDILPKNPSIAIKKVALARAELIKKSDQQYAHYMMDINSFSEWTSKLISEERN